MKKLYFFTFLLITSFSFAQQNVTANGGFETFTGTTPDSWTLIDSGIDTDEETTIINEGSKSLKVTVNTGTQASTDFRQDITVVNALEYTVSVDVYHPSGDNDARARLYVDGYTVYSDPSITDAWQTITTTYTATADEVIEVGLRFYDVTGFDGSSVMYIDNYQVIDPTVLSTDTFKTSDFSIYPNPATTGFVNIKTTTNQPIAVTAYNVLGKQVINTTVTANRLDVSSLTSGVYILKLTQEGATTTKKLVIK